MCYRLIAILAADLGTERSSIGKDLQTFKDILGKKAIFMSRKSQDLNLGTRDGGDLIFKQRRYTENFHRIKLHQIWCLSNLAIHNEFAYQ